MKVLFDPIYTTLIDRCASAFKFKCLAHHLLSKYEDLYIYWVIPEGLREQETEWLIDSDRIRYIAHMCREDRYQEYFRLTEEMEHVIAYNGDYWDWDLLVTNRSTQLPIIGMLSKKSKTRTTKKILLLEDMPMMSFKGSVAYTDWDRDWETSQL